MGRGATLCRRLRHLRRDHRRRLRRVRPADPGGQRPRDPHAGVTRLRAGGRPSPLTVPHRLEHARARVAASDPGRRRAGARGGQRRGLGCDPDRHDCTAPGSSPPRAATPSSRQATALGAHDGDPLRDRDDFVKAEVKAAHRASAASTSSSSTWARPPWRAALRCLATGGRLVITCGATTGPKARDRTCATMFFKNLSVLGSTMGSRGELMRHVVELIGRGPAASPSSTGCYPSTQVRRRPPAPSASAASSSARSSSPSETTPVTAFRFDTVDRAWVRAPWDGASPRSPPPSGSRVIARATSDRRARPPRRKASASRPPSTGPSSQADA